MSDKTCTWTRIEAGAYTDIWKTDCGRKARISGPVEVGVGFNPDPSGNYCKWCGGKLAVERWKALEQK